MEKRRFVAAGFNCMTGYGSGEGMRKEFGGMIPSGWFQHAEVGCIDAPRDILAGSVFAGVHQEDAMYQRSEWRQQ